MIEVSNLTKIYPNQKGVRNISFTVEKGEILGLLGPNGAGKTTIMRMITGYLYPTAGTIKVGESDIHDDPLGVRRQIGYLPENPPIYPEMTVAGYLRFVACLKGVNRKGKSAVNDEVTRVMELTGVDKVQRQLIGSLSKGYKQRVGLAQALLNSPPVLILDEPTVGLDPKQIIEIRNVIKNLAKEYTVILSSHILPEINMVCGRVVIIDRGQLVAVDTPDGLAQQFEKGQRVEIEAKGAPEKISALLDKVKSIQNWSCIEERSSSSRYQIQSQNATDGDIREAIFNAFAGASIPLLEMRTVNLSLEEIFLHLTTTETTDSVTPDTDESDSETHGKEEAI